MLANFRPLFKTERPQRQRARDRREGMSERHLVRIRALQCCVIGCQQADIEAHHLKSGPARLERGIGLKASDRFAVPLCGFLHHNEIEHLGSRREEQWFRDVGINNPYLLAKALWDRSQLIKDDERAVNEMLMIVHRHKIEAARILWDREETLRERARRGR